ncbi:MAG: amidohydrolase family protein [Patescibacteria group bacterium]|jgi:5-methylthioadenosine/S-adenosylhomocysteine deaminase
MPEHQLRYQYNQPNKTPATILLKNIPYIITANQQDVVEVQENKSILIEHNLIKNVMSAGEEHNLSTQVDLVYDAGLRGGIVLTPGLINAHAHPPMYLLRSTTLLHNDHATTEESLDIARAIEQTMTTEDQTIAALGDFTEQQKMGTTTILSHYHTPAATRAAAKHAYVRLFDAVSVASKTDPTASIERAIHTLTLKDDLISPGLTMHTLAQANKTDLKSVKQLMNKYPHVLLTIHCGETEQEVTATIQKHGQRPITVLEQAGLLNDHLIISHAVHLTEDEIKLLIERRVGIVHLPTSNRIHRSGQFHYATFFQYHGHHRIALGTDSVISKSRLDIVSEALQSKIMHQDTAYPVSYQLLFKMMTSNGARILGQEQTLGRVLPGYQADLVFWKLKNRDFIPFDPAHPETLLGNFITHGGANPRDVMVNGKFVISDRHHNLIDESQLLSDLQQHHVKLQGRILPSIPNPSLSPSLRLVEPEASKKGRG